MNVARIYSMKIQTEPEYSFMDNPLLVEAVMDVMLNSTIDGTSSLIGILANKTHKQSDKLSSQIINNLMGMGYDKKNAKQLIEFYLSIPES